MGGGSGMGMGWGRLRYEEDNTKKPKITKTLLVRILKYFIPYWKHLLIVLVAILASSDRKSVV